MKTIIKLFFSLFFLSSFWAKSQQVDWDKVNSSSIINLISQQNFENKIASTSSSVMQLGNHNIAELSLNSKTNIMVQQLGDQNSIYFNNSFSQKSTESAITTQGNNNIIDVTGSNSISDGMKINIKGDNKTVFMRNY